MSKSEEFFKKAKNILPGGVNSPVRAFGAVKKTPFFVEKAQGAYIYDVDGNEYIDYVCSWGPLILGHAHPKVVEAVKKSLRKRAYIWGSDRKGINFGGTYKKMCAFNGDDSPCKFGHRSCYERSKSCKRVYKQR